MNNYYIIDGLKPLALAIIWIAGVWSIVMKVKNGKKWKDQIANLIAIGIGCVFVINCEIVIDLCTCTIKSISGLIKSFDFSNLIKMGGRS